MKNFWNDSEARLLKADPLKLRVYTSRLLGRESSLVLHGGGNTSVKHVAKDLFGTSEKVLFVKGSGWDLATIGPAGFAPVKLDALQRMAVLKRLSDTQMVQAQRAAMTDPYAPNPSVEAILHAIIPFKFVDHTHADAIVAVSNSPGGRERIREIYGDKVLIVSYVMPGFFLAKKVYEMTRRMDFSAIEGIILLHHGIFTFSDSAKESYDRMIRLVSKAENYLKRKKVLVKFRKAPGWTESELRQLASLRQAVSKAAGTAMLASARAERVHAGFASLSNVTSVSQRGPLTPDHIIRIKRFPVVIGKDPQKDVVRFSENYRKYFKRYNPGDLTCLDPAPRWAVWPGKGLVCFGRGLKDVRVVSDITDHTIQAIQWAEGLGGWKALGEKTLFEMEYWELEQAKLKKGGATLPFQGKVALVTGAASGIGRACVETLAAGGAVVAALDIDPKIKSLYKKEEIRGIVCDVRRPADMKKCVEETIRSFGGLDILVSNAGIFPVSEKISDIRGETWDRSIAVNLSSHQRLLRICIPYLSLGIDPAVIIVGSKNVSAPGPGAANYSVAKAGLTQLARVAALELASSGIRVNVVHPNAVFDTAIWTKDVLRKRAKHYKMSIQEYKTSNLLKTEITSHDVARLVSSIAGPAFAKTTGAQIPIDGGNDRVI